MAYEICLPRTHNIRNARERDSASLAGSNPTDSVICLEQIYRRPSLHSLCYITHHLAGTEAIRTAPCVK